MSVRGIFHALLLSLVALASAQGQNVFVAPGSAGSTIGAYTPDPFQTSGNVPGSSQTSAIYSLPSGKYYVVTGGSTSSLTTYNSTLAAIGAVSGLGTITGSAFSPDARLLAVLTRSGLKVVDTQSDLVIGSFDSTQVGAEPYDAAFSLDGKRLFIASTTGRVVYAVDVSGSNPTVLADTRSRHWRHLAGPPDGRSERHPLCLDSEPHLRDRRPGDDQCKSDQPHRESRARGLHSRHVGWSCGQPQPCQREQPDLGVQPGESQPWSARSPTPPMTPSTSWSTQDLPPPAPASMRTPHRSSSCTRSPIRTWR